MILYICTSDGTIPILIPIPLTVVRFQFRFQFQHKIMSSIPIPWGSIPIPESRFHLNIQILVGLESVDSDYYGQGRFQFQF